MEAKDVEFSSDLTSRRMLIGSKSFLRMGLLTHDI